MPAGTNIFTGPVNALAELVASASLFQSLTLTDGKVTAATHIYKPGLPFSEVLSARPFAVIGISDKHQMKLTSDGNWLGSGTLQLMLEADIPSAHLGTTSAKMYAAENWALSTFGGILAEILTDSFAAGALRINAIRLVQLARSPEEIANDEGQFYQMVVDVDWGIA